MLNFPKYYVYFKYICQLKVDEVLQSHHICNCKYLKNILKSSSSGSLGITIKLKVNTLTTKQQLRVFQRSSYLHKFRPCMASITPTLKLCMAVLTGLLMEENYEEQRWGKWFLMANIHHKFHETTSTGTTEWTPWPLQIQTLFNLLYENQNQPLPMSFWVTIRP